MNACEIMGCKGDGAVYYYYKNSNSIVCYCDYCGELAEQFAIGNPKAIRLTEEQAKKMKVIL